MGNGTPGQVVKDLEAAFSKRKTPPDFVKTKNSSSNQYKERWRLTAAAFRSSPRREC
jgi:hypothetical protein